MFYNKGVYNMMIAKFTYREVEEIYLKKYKKCAMKDWIAQAKEFMGFKMRTAHNRLNSECRVYVCNDDILLNICEIMEELQCEK